MSVLDIDISQLVDKNDKKAQEICGVAHLKARDRAMLRMAEAGAPHVRWKNKVLFHLPSLRAYVAAQVAGQLAQAGESEGRK